MANQIITYAAASKSQLLPQNPPCSPRWHFPGLAPLSQTKPSWTVHQYKLCEFLRIQVLFKWKGLREGRVFLHSWLQNYSLPAAIISHLLLQSILPKAGLCFICHLCVWALKWGYRFMISITPGWLLDVMIPLIQRTEEITCYPSRQDLHLVHFRVTPAPST